MLLALLPLALAGPATSSLSWVRLDGAEACVAAPELAEAVEARLGRPVFLPPAEAELAVEGHVERIVGDAPGWRARLRLTDHAGVPLGDRVVESRAPGCDELGEAVAVTLALMIDPTGGAALDPPPVAPPPPVDSAPVASPPPVDPQPAPAAARWGVDVHAALTGGYGLLPGVTVGGSATVLVRPPRFVPLVVTGEVEPFGRDAAGVATFGRATGGVGLCPVALAGREDRWLLRACAGVDAGAIVAFAPSEPLAETERLLVQGRASVRPSFRVWGPLLVDVAAHLVVPFRAVAFATRDGVEVYRPAVVAGMVDVGVGGRF